MKKIILLLCIVFWFWSIVSASDVLEDLQVPLTPWERVTDLADIIPDGQEVYLNQKLEWVDGDHNVEVAIVTLPELEWYAIEEVGIEIAEARWVGEDEIDSGIIVLMAMDEKQRRIETGYGVEWDIPDILAYDMGKKILVPAFREWKFAEWFDKLIDAFTDALTWVFPGQTDTQPIQINDKIWWLMMLWILSFVIATILRWIYGKDMARRKKAASIWPLGTGLLWLIIWWSFTGGFILFMIMSFLRSMVMLAQQVTKKNNRWDNHWWWWFGSSGGWWWWSFGGWFSGFGGWSFWGGGASWSW